VEQLLWTKAINDGGSHRGIPVIAWNFSTGFIGNSIVSTPYILVFGDAHIIEHKPISSKVDTMLHVRLRTLTLSHKT